MKHVILTAMLVLAAGLLAEPAGAAMFDSQSSYRSGSGISMGRLNRDDIIMVQQRLADRGYYRGSVDGIYGPQTAHAVRAFQEDNGLTASGRLTSATLDELDLATVQEIEPAAGEATYQETTIFGEMYTSRGVEGFSAEEYDAHHSTCLECADGIYGHGGRPDIWDR